MNGLDKEYKEAKELVALLLLADPPHGEQAALALDAERRWRRQP